MSQFCSNLTKNLEIGSLVFILKTFYKVGSNLLGIVLRKCNKKYSITPLPTFGVEGDIEAETRVQ